ncbi:MAG: hypothetical protein ABFS03_06290 [Chloroflexota bacterium]
MRRSKYTAFFFRNLWLIAAAALLFFAAPERVVAQDYAFSLDSEVVHVYWNQDGTISLDYTFVFSNSPDAAAIDFVDVGLPNNNYQIESISAEIDGNSITDITISPYVTHGVALGLGDQAIKPGETGTVKVSAANIGNPFYIDSENETYASFLFSPTWFGSEFVHGTSDISVVFHLPLGVNPNEPRWHTAPLGFPEAPETGFDEDGRITYAWQNAQANGYSQYIFGASIPRQYVLSTFKLNSETVDVYLHADGNVYVEYNFDFINASKTASLTHFSVYYPSNGYNATNISANVNGVPIYESASDYSYAYIELGENAIPPGESGTIHLNFNIPSEMYTSSWWDDEYAYATLEFSPDTFSQDWIFGPIDLVTTFHLPSDLNIEDVGWSGPEGPGDPPITDSDSYGAQTATWHVPDLPAGTPLNYRLDLPRGSIAENAIYSYPKPSLLSRMGIDEEVFFGLLCFLSGIGMVVGLFSFARRSKQRRKLKYLPPKIRIEGHGIKRGLTAVEAAALMEESVDKIMTMILFSVIQKNAASITSRDPIKLHIEDPAPKNLRGYEVDFLNAFGDSKKSSQQKDLREMMIKLIRVVGKKMKGFSRKETLKYYRTITRKAWEQVEASNTPEVKSQRFEEHMGWTMLDKDFNDRTQEVFQNIPVYLPSWWNRYDPSFGGDVSAGTSPISSGIPKPLSGPQTKPTPTLPHLPGADFAAAVVSDVQNFSSGIVGNMVNFTSSITNRTNPIPIPTPSSGSSTRSSSRSSSRRSGGSSCACACACAGCACACAGGGR